jgi:CHAT domain
MTSSCGLSRTREATVLIEQAHQSNTEQIKEGVFGPNAEIGDAVTTARIALVAYHTTSAGTAIFLVLRGTQRPLIFDAKDPTTDQPVTSDHLLDVARRLLVDFHGLPEDWDSRPDRDSYVRVLRNLPPATPLQQRTFPIRDALLGNARFNYQLTYWQRLSEALLPRDLKEAIAGCDLLCVVPHGPLHLLPFAALRWSPEEYLIERIGLASAPSATVLRFCQYKNPRRRQRHHRPTSCFVACAPTPDDNPALFDADREALETIFSGRDGLRFTSLTGPPGTLPASKDMIAKHASCHDVIHLACHGVFASDLGSQDALESALLVSNGRTVPTLGDLRRLPPQERGAFLMSAREVFGFDLQADLVTLRACSSGRAEVHSGDELLGLSRAFLYAGSPSLIVALWNVSQRSSRVLLNEFYRLWLDESALLPKWAALREAQVRMLRGRDRHPYHWAPYVLVGDWL